METDAKQITKHLRKRPDDLVALAEICGVDLNSQKSIRRFIVFFQNEIMAKMPDVKFGDQPELCPLEYTFVPGIGCKKITIPAGLIIVGKIHKEKHVNFLLEGKVTVLTERGGIETLTAPLQMVSAPGTKRLLITHEKSVWTTVHSTNATTPEELEKDVIAESYESYVLSRKEVFGWLSSTP